MKRLFGFLLKILRWLVSLLLVLILLLTSIVLIPAGGLSWQITNRDNLKSWVKQSGLYNHNKDLVIDVLNSSSETGEGLTQITDRLKDPNDELTKLIDLKLTPVFMESAFNNVIDGLYDWLNGKNGNKIQLNIRLAKDRTELINILITLFREKVKASPPCESGVSVPDDTNPISLSCLPNGYDINKVDNYIHANENTPEFEKLYTQVQFGEQAVPVDQKTSDIAVRVFLGLAVLPYLVPVYLVLMTLLISWLLPITKKKALIGVGVFAGLLPFVVTLGLLIFSLKDYLLKNVLQTRLSASNLVIYQKYFSDLANIVIGSLINGVVFYSFLLLLVVVLSVVGSIYLLKKLAERTAVKNVKT